MLRNLGNVDALAGHSHGGLVLRLQHHIHNLELFTSINILRTNTTVFGI